jgi:hypothetical protein
MPTSPHSTFLSCLQGQRNPLNRPKLRQLGIGNDLAAQTAGTEGV